MKMAAQNGGFGLEVVKQEGARILVDAGAGPSRGRAVKTHWMELCLEEGWTRGQVHAHVENWLMDHGWTTKPTKNPHI